MLYFRNQISAQKNIPIERQARIVQTLAWGVICLSLVGGIATWFIVGNRIDGLQLISTASSVIISCALSLSFSYKKQVMISTMILTSMLYIGTTIALVPYGILKGDVIIFGYFLPLILLSEFWKFIGIVISFILTSISLIIVQSLEISRLAGWATRDDILAVKVGFMFITMILISQVIMRSRHEVSEVNKELLLSNNQLLIIQQQLRSFTAGIVHDFGTPVQRLYAQLACVDKQKRHLVQEQLDLMSALIEQTRTFLEVQDGDRLELRQDVVSIISVAANAMASAASSQALHRHIHFELDCPTPLRSQFVLGDATAIRRIVDNLLKNALGVANPESTIVIRIQAVEQYLELAVIDEGPGIPEEDQPYVFEPYWSSSNGAQHTGTGWGVGLAVVRQLTSAMGGDCGVTSIPGSGSTFWIRLQQCEPSS